MPSQNKDVIHNSFIRVWHIFSKFPYTRIFIYSFFMINLLQEMPLLHCFSCLIAGLFVLTSYACLSSFYQIPCYFCYFLLRVSDFLVIITFWYISREYAEKYYIYELIWWKYVFISRIAFMTIPEYWWMWILVTFKDKDDDDLYALLLFQVQLTFSQGII